MRNMTLRILLTILAVCWGCIAIAQPSYTAFRQSYQPHNQLPGESEASVIMMDALSAEEIASFLNKYWQAKDPEMVFAMLISISREKAADALTALDAPVASSALNYMEGYWALDLIWYLSPVTYKELAPHLNVLKEFDAPNMAESALPQKDAAVPQEDRDTKFDFPHPQNLLFVDEFEDNRYGWEIVESGDIQQQVGNGHYQLKRQHTDGGCFIDRGLYIMPLQDFYITARMKRQSGDYGAFYGLSWGRTGAENYYAFCINPQSQQADIVEVNQGNKRWLMNRGSIEGLVTQKGYNELGIQKKGNRIYFFINGQLYFEGAYKPFLGQHVGFLLMGEVQVDVDYLQIYAPQPSINVVEQPISGSHKKKLGAGVNTEAIEYGAVVSADGKSLFFSRKDNNDAESDIWVAYRTADTQWSKAERLPFPINNVGNNDVVAVSTDGQSLILNNRYTAEGYPKGGGISYTRQNAAGDWTVPSDIEITNYYNDLASVSHTVSSDGQTLIMAVKRKNSTGNLDLYFATKDQNGIWSEPQHMGNVVNTPGQESGPFLASDNRTLYFSSDGLPGYGDADVFMTRRIGEGWTQWSEPKNLGPSINTMHWDGYYTVPADGKYAYLSSYSKGKGHSDIYSIKLMDEAKPSPVVLLQGIIYDAHSNEPVDAEIIYQDAITKEELGRVKPHPKTGFYKLILPYGQKFKIVTKAKSYLPASISLDLQDFKRYQELSQDFVLIPFEVGKSTRIKNIFFKRGKATLLPASFPELDRIVALMRSYPKMEVRIEGHTDGLGNPAVLQKLSWLRAKSVKDYLVDKGIDIHRIEGKGYGRSRPVAPNDTEENRQKNRRVELVITKLE